MANNQVRLDPEICQWVDEVAIDWEVSRAQATSRLLRAHRQLLAAPAPSSIVASVSGGEPSSSSNLPPTQSQPRRASVLSPMRSGRASMNQHAAAMLRANAEQQ